MQYISDGELQSGQNRIQLLTEVIFKFNFVLKESISYVLRQLAMWTKVK